MGKKPQAEPHKRRPEYFTNKELGELASADFDEVVAYFAALRQENKKTRDKFGPYGPLEVNLAMKYMDASTLVDWAKETEETYIALKQYVKNRFEPSMAFPFERTQESIKKDTAIAVALCLDLMSDSPGQTKAKGRRLSYDKHMRDILIRQYFDLMAKGTTLPKGTNTDDRVMGESW